MRYQGRSYSYADLDDFARVYRQHAVAPPKLHVIPLQSVRGLRQFGREVHLVTVKYEAIKVGERLAINHVLTHPKPAWAHFTVLSVNHVDGETKIRAEIQRGH